MNIALIGATGTIGSAVLTELTSRGHMVTAIARHPEKIPAAEGITPKAVDLYDTAALAEILKGHDAVISAFNVDWTKPTLREDFLNGARSVQAATKQAGVPRLLALGGAGSLRNKDGVQLVDTPEFPEFIKTGAGAMRDYLTELKEERDLDWVMISPPVFFSKDSPAERRGTYRVAKDEPIFDEQGSSNISPADMAIAIVDEIEQATRHRERFTVGW